VVDPNTGELSESTRYRRLADIPFPVGWPVNYVRPNDPPMAWLRTLPPRRVPSHVSPAAMIANFVLIVSAIAALVYVLQKTRYRFSLLFLIGSMSAYPLYIGIARLVSLLGGYRAVEWYSIAVYFSPIPIAIAVRWSLFPRWNWRNLRPRLTTRPRCAGEYDNPEDALAAAARLEKRGEWDDAINHYRQAAARWPEHNEYAQECSNRVAQRQSLGQSLQGSAASCHSTAKPQTATAAGTCDS
jgi:hypothetical protein